MDNDKIYYEFQVAFGKYCVHNKISLRDIDLFSEQLKCHNTEFYGITSIHKEEDNVRLQPVNTREKLCKSIEQYLTQQNLTLDSASVYQYISVLYDYVTFARALSRVTYTFKHDPKEMLRKRTEVTHV